ncbi:MAG: MAPEG family protein [Burkholderiales bacterium]|nr:MAPEG family protein [Burkholderiales bacterium]
MTLLWTSWITIAALAMYFWTAYAVAKARMRCQVRAPFVDGPPEFLRALRVQGNTVEQLIFFLPALWLCAFWSGDRLAAAGGAVWVLGRIWYALAYYRAAEKRGPGFTISLLAAVALLLGAIAGMSMR